MSHLIWLWVALALSGVGIAAAVTAQGRLRAAVLTARGETVLPGWRYWVRWLGKGLEPKGGDRDEILALLNQAGRTERDAMDRFAEEKALGWLFGLTVGAGVMLAIQTQVGLFLGLVAFVVGVLGPKRRVEAQATERRELIGAALPSAVDLLMTSIDAGLSIEQAIARVGRELTPSWPALAKELTLTAMECEASIPLAEALRRLARRVELEDLSALAGVVAQAHALGAPIVKTLAEYTDNTRKLRTSNLEERAGKLATQLTFPLAAFLVPSALVFMLGPAMLQLVRLMAKS